MSQHINLRTTGFSDPVKRVSDLKQDVVDLIGNLIHVLNYIRSSVINNPDCYAIKGAEEEFNTLYSKTLLESGIKVELLEKIVNNVVDIMSEDEISQLDPYVIALIKQIRKGE